jgi:predicted glutamine amidotransferase
MCELFAMTAGQHFTAQEYLPLFADKSRANISGWGIGFFRNGQVFIEKSCEGIYAGDQVHDSFQRLARVIDSRVILSHIRCTKSGHKKESHAQPLYDRFLDHQWLFGFAGESKGGADYVSPRPILDENLLAARVFEFIRDGLLAQTVEWPGQSLYQGLAVTCKKLITRYPGEYIFFLANESVLFAFLNHAQVLLYRPPETMGEFLVLTTVAGGLTLDPDHWRSYANPNRTRGQLLLISGSDLLYLGHL